MNKNSYTRKIYLVVGFKERNRRFMAVLNKFLIHHYHKGFVKMTRPQHVSRKMNVFYFQHYASSSSKTYWLFCDVNDGNISNLFFRYFEMIFINC